MTKEQFIKNHPKSYLAATLQKNNWPMDTKIEVGSGQIAPETRSSNLYRALQRSQLKEYEVGAKLQYQSQGRAFAVA